MVKNCNQTEIKSCKWRLYQIISNTIVAKYLSHLSLFHHLQLTWHFASDQSACMERHIFYIPMLQPPLLFTDLRALLLVLSLNHLNCLVFNVAAFFLLFSSLLSPQCLASCLYDVFKTLKQHQHQSVSFAPHSRHSFWAPTGEVAASNSIGRILWLQSSRSRWLLLPMHWNKGNFGS